MTDLETSCLPSTRSWFAAIGLALLGLLLSLYSSYEYVHVRAFPFAGEAACNINAAFNCEQAIRSEYADFIGKSLGSWGAIFYSCLLFFLCFWSPGKKQDGQQDDNPGSNSNSSEGPQAPISSLLVISTLSLFLSLFLLGITLTSLTSYCPVCIALYIVSFGIFLLSYLFEKQFSLLKRIQQGVLQIFVLPSHAIQFFFRQFGDRFFSVQAPLFIVLTALIPLSLTSDMLFMSYLSSQSDLDERTSQVVAEWQNQPVQQIPFTRDAGNLNDYQKGSGPIRIVEFFDYECPACRDFYYEMKDIVEEFSDSVSIEYRNYPLDSACNPDIPQPFHKYACDAAELARCAGEQGKYFEAVEYLLTLPAFDSRPKGDIEMALAETPYRMELDTESIATCLASDRQLLAIRRDAELASSLELQATPTIWVNGKLLKDRGSLKSLVTFLVQQEAK